MGAHEDHTCFWQICPSERPLWKPEQNKLDWVGGGRGAGTGEKATAIVLLSKNEGLSK